jgi:hypothetical protein
MLRAYGLVKAGSPHPFLLAAPSFFPDKQIKTFGMAEAPEYNPGLPSRRGQGFPRMRDRASPARGTGFPPPEGLGFPHKRDRASPA